MGRRTKGTKGRNPHQRQRQYQRGRKKIPLSTNHSHSKTKIGSENIGNDDHTDSHEGDDREDKLDNDQFVKNITDRGNVRMESYYASQGLHHHHFFSDTHEGQDAPKNQFMACSNFTDFERERQAWRQCTTTVLPASFRIGRHVAPALRLQMEAQLRRIVETLNTTNSDSTDSSSSVSSPTPVGGGGMEIVALKPLLFLPHAQNAYQLGHLDRATIRRHPRYTTLHDWLMQQTDAGLITRQETVSMIPPILLAPNPNDVVLDMCAAPGSKTSQLLEALSSSSSSSGGCLVANDVNRHRAFMLSTQLHRGHVLHTNPAVLITACAAQHFPCVVQFDKILADVPCSGDGTLRKNIDVWTSWSVRGALALHALQLEIAWKGASQLLKIGGWICYSTCSMSPVENEAVVAELLRKSQGALELVECRQVLSPFKTRPGLSTWKVYCDDKPPFRQHQQQQETTPSAQTEEEEETSAPERTNTNSTSNPNCNGEDSADTTTTRPSCNDDAQSCFAPTSMDEMDLVRQVESTGLKLFTTPAEVPIHLQKRVRASVFPPTPAEVDQFHLERCIRCLPHDNDTGGFFVALLKKTAPLSAHDRRNIQKKIQTSPPHQFDSPQHTATITTTNSTSISTSIPATPSESDPEPNSKRFKLNDSDGSDKEWQLIEADGNVPAEEESNIQNHYLGNDKKNLMRDADGNAIPDLGRDDFVQVSDEVLAPLIEFYGLSATTLHRDQLMIRAGGESKIVSYIARPVQALFEAGLQKRVTVITSGLKVLIRKGQNCEVDYRLSHEGLHFLAPHMTKRKFVVNLSDFLVLLSSTVVPFTDLSSDLQSKLMPLSVGSIAIVLEGGNSNTDSDEYNDDDDDQMMLSKWRCRGEKVDNLVPKVDLQAIQDKLQAQRNALRMTDR